jgi:hypothetical protein
MGYRISLPTSRLSTIDQGWSRCWGRLRPSPAIYIYTYPPQQFKIIHTVHYGNRIRGCDPFPGRSGHMKRDSSDHESVQKKPTHTSWYLNFNSNHPPYVKRGIIHSLHDRASTIRQEWQDLLVEVNNLRRDLQLYVYPQCFINSVVRSMGSSRQKKKEKPLGSVYIPYVKGVSKKFKHIGNSTILGLSSKLNTLCVVRSWEPDPKEIRNRRHVA